MADRLQRFLADYDIAMLRALAHSRGVALSSNRQPEATDQLAQALLDPLSVRVALSRLSAAAKQGLETVQAAGGRVRTAQFCRRFGPIQRHGPGRLEREVPWQAPTSAAEELVYAGLLFPGFDRDAAGAGEFLFVPADLLPLLPPPPKSPATPLVQTVAPPARKREGGPAAARDLFVYLVHLQARDVRPYAGGRLPRHDTAALRRRLSNLDEGRLDLLRHLAGALGFVRLEQGLLRLEATPVKRWLSSSPAGQLAALQEAWRDEAAWSDLRHVPGLEFDESKGWHLRDDPVATRREALLLLARCPAEGWWHLNSFVEAVKEAQPDFLRPDGDYESWYVRDAESGVYLSGFAAWDRVEGALLADLLNGPLFWLGVVDVGPSERGTVCQMTRAGLRLLGGGEGEPEAPVSAPITVAPDLWIELPPPVNLYTRFQLERFADAEGESPCRYRLTAGSLGRALGRGLRVEQVLAFLQQASTRAVPPGAAAQLRLWAGRFDSVRLEEMVLLQAKNDRVLKELSMLPETRDLIEELLTSTTALVRRADLPRLRVELRKQGYLYEPSEGEAQD